MPRKRAEYKDATDLTAGTQALLGKRWCPQVRLSSADAVRLRPKYAFDDGCVEISNAIAETALRYVALGRRNFMFAGPDDAGERAAAMCSPIVYRSKKGSKRGRRSWAKMLREVQGQRFVDAGWPGDQQCA